ncbi:MAG: penicillin-binding protein, partial [Flavobacteriia bacterium]|nr:penicillin-binding protein [Flavobacteriia bacterium]
MNFKILLFFTVIVGSSIAQTGGITGFNFLNLPFSARTTGLGGSFITARDLDVSLGIQNPALLNADMHKRGSISQTLLAGGINSGQLNYAHHFANNITGAAHFRYVSYGKMKRTDINGSDLGTFSPGDFVLGVSAGKSINERLHIGATFNVIYSQLDNYIAFGNSLDI